MTYGSVKNVKYQILKEIKKIHYWNIYMKILKWKISWGLIGADFAIAMSCEGKKTEEGDHKLMCASKHARVKQLSTSLYMNRVALIT